MSFVNQEFTVSPVVLKEWLFPVLCKEIYILHDERFQVQCMGLHKRSNQLKWEPNTELACEENNLTKGRNNSLPDHLSQSWVWEYRLDCPMWDKRATFIRETVYKGPTFVVSPPLPFFLSSRCPPSSSSLSAGVLMKWPVWPKRGLARSGSFREGPELSEAD